MLLNMDWYADQMKLKAYESDPLPISLEHSKYQDGTRDIVFVHEQTQQAYPAEQILEFIASDNPGTKVTTQSNKKFDYTPTRYFILPVDTSKVISNGTVKAKDANLIEKQLVGHFAGSRLTKSDLIAFDIITNNNWERPIYFVSTGHSGLLGLDNYLQLDGLAYRLVPIKTESRYDRGRIDPDILYTKLMEEFKWGRMNESDCYLDNFHLRTLNVVRMRMRFSQLANALIQTGDNERAEKVLDRVVELTPNEKIPYDYFIIPIAEGYYRINKFDKANDLLNKYYDILEKTTDYYLSMSMKYKKSIENEIYTNMQIISQIGQYASRYNQKELADKATKYINDNSSGLY
jgi:tetratricopeptide (TPR) repeat protein